MKQQGLNNTHNYKIFTMITVELTSTINLTQSFLEDEHRNLN